MAVSVPDASVEVEAVVIAAADERWMAPVLGLTVLSRAIAAAQRAGAAVVHVDGPRLPSAWIDQVRREIDGLPSRPNVRFGSVPSPAAALIVVSAPIVFDPRVVQPSHAGSEGASVVAWAHSHEQPPALWRVAPGALGGATAGAGDEDLGVRLARQPRKVFDPGAALCDRVQVGSNPTIEAKLLAQARKQSDTWVARNVDRRISLALTRRLARTHLTPNQITWAATAIGLAGVGWLAWGTPDAQLVGAWLLTLSIIVDGCDGEVARIKFMESEFGRKLDFFLDNVVNVGAIFAVGAGYAWHSGETLYLYAAAVNAAAAAAAVGPVYMLFFRSAKEGVRLDAAVAPARRWAWPDLVEGIAGRDFVYAILALALLGRAHWFTLLCLAGVLLFLAAVIILWATGQRREAGPVDGG